MRFVADGPALPDDLLVARDMGHVLFFCGAGVSQARAHLPNFATLADRVLALLGSAQDSPARRLFSAASDFERHTGLTGLVATDRIFGLLEREFEPIDVRQAVAQALQPAANADLGAHRTLLDLSRNRAGVARLVTTNFDLLFEACDETLSSSNPPRLPDPRRDADFRGVVHLHGRVDEAYQQARDDEFVLSSADFGHAYLSDGWATRYIQALLERFRIVFVGYSADDPPVQYLLEALNRFAKPGQSLYAFQSGDSEQATAQWSHKGVSPIPYSSIDGHAALWTTLSAWAERARDVDGWHHKLIARAEQGPTDFLPHERGMVAHLTATESGARYLANAVTPLPATWLAVLDPKVRFARPDRAYEIESEKQPFDPFDAFGLDHDEIPLPPDPRNPLADRPVPQGAWDAWATTDLDRTLASAASVPTLRGPRAAAAADLPPRLHLLGQWIRRISSQPAAVWWAAQQSTMHPSVQDGVERQLRSGDSQASQVVRETWRRLLACWRQPEISSHPTQYRVQAAAKQDGWSALLVREAIALYRPYITAASSGKRPPGPSAEQSFGNLAQFDIEYPKPYQSLGIDPKFLSYAVAQFREHLELAVQLELDFVEQATPYFDTIRPDDGKQLGEDSHGLTGQLIAFTNMLVELAGIDPHSARVEVRRWLGKKDPVFVRLQIWAAGRKDMTTYDEAGRTFLDLDDEAFWSHRQERDLLYSLRDRWQELTNEVRERIESRLRDGDIPWAEQLGRAKEAVAHTRLNKLRWLTTQGVKFSFDVDAEMERLRTAAPSWTERSAEGVAQPMVSEAFPILTDTDIAPLADLPVDQILERAAQDQREDFFSRTRKDPFRGLAGSRPKRAFRAIAAAARRGEFIEWAWRTLLYSESDTMMSTRMLSAVGSRIGRMSFDQVLELAHPITEWLLAKSQALQSNCPTVFDAVWRNTVAALSRPLATPQPHRSNRRWVDEGLNRPAGRLADTVLRVLTAMELPEGAGLPIEWSKRLAELLDLPGDHGRHAIAITAYHTNWLFHVDARWTDEHLLTTAHANVESSAAFWAGYFWGAKAPQPALFQILRASLLSLARQADLGRDHSNKVAGFLLIEWGSEPQLVTDVELREVLIHSNEDLRIQTLWYLSHWGRKESRWNDLLIPFLTRVWPRQRSVRSAAVSSRLADLAFAFPERFSEIVVAILPNLTATNPASMMSVDASQDVLIASHAPRLLDLLHTIVGADSLYWPEYLPALVIGLASHPETKSDPRLIDLRRRAIEGQ